MTEPELQGARRAGEIEFPGEGQLFTANKKLSLGTSFMEKDKVDQKAESRLSCRVRRGNASLTCDLGLQGSHCPD